MVNDNLNNRLDTDVNGNVDTNDHHDAKVGAELGGAGGIVTGAIAGSVAGPIGTVIGAAIGGIAGAVTSGAAVEAVDHVDHDGSHRGDYSRNPGGVGPAGATESRVEANTVGNGVPGVQTGGRDYDGTPDTRGITEKAADTLTGDNLDDKTGKPLR